MGRRRLTDAQMLERVQQAPTELARARADAAVDAAEADANESGRYLDPVVGTATCYHSAVAVDDNTCLQCGAVVPPLHAARAEQPGLVTGESAETVARALMVHYSGERVRAAAEVANLARELGNDHRSDGMLDVLQSQLEHAVGRLAEALAREGRHADAWRSSNPYGGGAT